MHDARTGEMIREKRWERVRRIAAWHGGFSARHPRLAAVFNTCLRRSLTTYARLELPRAVGLLEAAIAATPGAWIRDGVHEGRSIWHGGRTRLNLADYYQRLAHYLGRYHEVPLQLLIGRALRGGDSFIDGGANSGLVAMIAAWQVGPTGKVWAFEPNPQEYERLWWHAEANLLTQITPLPMGLSDRDEELELLVPGRDNGGAGTCAPLPDRYGGQISQRTRVRLGRADGMELEIHGLLMVKLDIEGFETRALRGMAELIERHRPLVVCEMNSEMLHRAGTSPRDVCEFMTSRGYLGFAMDAALAILRTRRLKLFPIDLDLQAVPFDVVWIHPESPFQARLRRCMAT